MEPLSLVPAHRYAELDLLRFLASLALVLLLAWAAHALVERPLSRQLGLWFTQLLAATRLRLG